MLAASPGPYNHQPVYERLNDRRSSLLTFLELLQEYPSAVLARWQKQLAAELQRVSATILQAIKQLEDF